MIKGVNIIGVLVRMRNTDNTVRHCEIHVVGILFTDTESSFVNIWCKDGFSRNDVSFHFHTGVFCQPTASELMSIHHC